MHKAESTEFNFKLGSEVSLVIFLHQKAVWAINIVAFTEYIDATIQYIVPIQWYNCKTYVIIIIIITNSASSLPPGRFFIFFYLFIF